MTTSLANALFSTFVIWISFVIGHSSFAEEPAAAVYHSAFRLAFSPDGKLLAVSDHTAGAVAVIDLHSGEVV